METKQPEQNPYRKKTRVFTRDFIANLSKQNREQRLDRYPETKQFVDEQAIKGE